MKKISEITAGETVIHTTRYERKVRTVERVTATQVVVQTGVYAGSREPVLSRFNRQSGQKIGQEMWETDYITVPETGEVEQIQADNEPKLLAARLAAVNWERPSYAGILKQVDAILATVAEGGAQ